MEKTPPNSNLTSHDNVKNLLQEDPEEKPSSSTTEAKSDSDASDKKQQATENASAPSTSRNSPDPCCAICLEPLQNKSFTNSCLHMFCFKCLVEWSKIKPECPLCKQQFKSIIHNVQENFQYDTYYIKNRATESILNFTQVNQGLSSTFRINTSFSRPSFRYRTTLMSNRFLQGSHTLYPESSLQVQFENHRRRFAPHSVSVTSSSPSANFGPSAIRRDVYERNWWVKPVQDGRYRLVNPAFFRLNPACTHRLLPWLNRELNVLLRGRDTQVWFVTELIMSLILRYEILSQEFYFRLRPQLGANTRHFIHEFYYFAVSPYDMDTYDVRASYEYLENGPITDTVNCRQPNNTDNSQSNNTDNNSQSNSDVITLDNDDEITSESQSANNDKRLHKKSKEKSSSKKDRVEKMIFKRNRETDSWVSFIHDYSSKPLQDPERLVHDLNRHDYFSNPRPSTSRTNACPSPFERPMTPLSLRSTMISPVQMESSEEECEIVEIVKPRAERTPEIIELSSDDEVLPIDVSSVENGDDSVISQSSNESSDIECVFVKEVTNNPERSLYANISLAQCSPMNLTSYSSISMPSPSSSISFKTYSPPSPSEPSYSPLQNFLSIPPPSISSSLSISPESKISPTFSRRSSVSPGTFHVLPPPYSPTIRTFSPASPVTDPSSTPSASPIISNMSPIYSPTSPVYSYPHLSPQFVNLPYPTSTTSPPSYSSSKFSCSSAVKPILNLRTLSPPELTSSERVSQTDYSRAVQPVNLSSKRSSPVNLSKKKLDSLNTSEKKSTADNDKKLGNSSTDLSSHPSFNTSKASTSSANPSKLELTDSSENTPTQETKRPHTPSKPSVLSKIVMPNSNDVNSNNYSLWRSPNSKKRKPHLENSSESDTDVEKKNSSKKKKLKLRSVVAHFSYDNSDDKVTSNHRSSHKKHKEKKKKKHGHKYKRIYTDTDSSSS